MILNNYSRLIVWGVVDQDTYILGELVFLSDGLTNNTIDLFHHETRDYHSTVQIPDKYLNKFLAGFATNLPLTKVSKIR